MRSVCDDGVEDILRGVHGYPIGARLQQQIDPALVNQIDATRVA
jgi:hypothetical protein